MLIEAIVPPGNLKRYFNIWWHSASNIWHRLAIWVGDAASGFPDSYEPVSLVLLQQLEPTLGIILRCQCSKEHMWPCGIDALHGLQASTQRIYLALSLPLCQGGSMQIQTVLMSTCWWQVHGTHAYSTCALLITNWTEFLVCSTAIEQESDIPKLRIGQVEAYWIGAFFITSKDVSFPIDTLTNTLDHARSIACSSEDLIELSTCNKHRLETCLAVTLWSCVCDLVCNSMRRS